MLTDNVRAIIVFVCIQMSETSTSNLTASKLEDLKTRLRNDRENALAKLAIRKKRRKKQLREGGKPNN